MNGMSLAGFQDSLACALSTDAAVPQLATLMRQPGFSVYRNTVMTGCIDALLANFPAVARLVGEAWFRNAAAVYVRQELPRDARLLFYGGSFPDFLAHFPPASELPYLPDVARLDRFWIECHAARDDDAQNPAELFGLAPDALGAAIVCPRASTRWKWFHDLPIYTIWSANRDATSRCDDLIWRGEGALLVRRGAEVRAMEIGAAHCTFLDACAAGRTLADAAVAALEADAHADIAQLIASLLDACALSAQSHFPP